MNAELRQYVIYKNPSDLPQYKYVLRGWSVGWDESLQKAVITADSEISGHADDEEGLMWMRRELERQGLFCLGRYDSDDPAILEVWI